jgi:DNA-binding winged helix-turn-helix (wHTH) protein/tetratricopeptide (TPR) repeat protein
MKLSTATRTDSREPEFSFGNFRLERDGTFHRGETQIHLPPKELAALRFLLAHAGRVVAPAQLKQALWGDVHVTADSVPRCLSSLRGRLEPEQWIQTIYKRGYRLAGPVRRDVCHDRSPSRLVIMPFAVGHHVADHLGPAIAEEVTTRLTTACLSWVSVLARDSAFTLARQGLTAVRVGQVLEADLVLAGTLLAMPTHYRLRAEMIRVEDGTQVWVEDLLVRTTNLIDLQSELVQRLVFRLGGESISLNAPACNHQQGSARPDAYETFLRGHHEWQSHERHRMQDGMERLINATELDPSLIPAQVDLANVCVTQEFYGFLSPDVAAKQIRRIGASISDISDNAPALLPALGWVSFHIDGDLAKALDMFSVSAHLPHDPWTTRLRVMLALSRHRFDEAVEWLQSALLVDPYAPWLHARLAWAYHLAEQASDSVEQIEKSLSLFPDHEGGLLYGAVILAFNGQAERAARLAQELVRRTPFFDIATAIHGYALARNGQEDEAYAILERLQWLSRERFVLRSFTPAVYAALGDIDGAIAELSAAADARCPWFFQMLADPRLKSLHRRPAFEQMRERLAKMEAASASNLEYQV